MTNRDLTQRILALRGAKATLDPRSPYAYFDELELSRHNQVENVTTLFLTNRECPYRCAMCDLWKHTLDRSVTVEEILEQIQFGIRELPPAKHIKLYNSGNFFDAKAIPPSALPAIAGLVADYETVIVENHPNLTNEKAIEFSRRLQGKLEVALGLETSDEIALEKLNKGATRADFSRAASLLRDSDIAIRAFVLLKPPFTTKGTVESCVDTVRFANELGVSVCSIIPLRDGNGFVDELIRRGEYSLPSLEDLEDVFDEVIGLPMRVFVDLWDIKRLSRCEKCLSARTSRLEGMNFTQVKLPRVECECERAA